MKHAHTESPCRVQMEDNLTKRTVRIPNMAAKRARTHTQKALLNLN